MAIRLAGPNAELNVFACLFLFPKAVLGLLYSKSEGSFWKNVRSDMARDCASSVIERLCRDTHPEMVKSDCTDECHTPIAPTDRREREREHTRMS